MQLLVILFIIKIFALINIFKYFRFSENLFQSYSIEQFQNFQWLSNKNMLIPQAEGYFENPKLRVLEEPMLFLLVLRWNL